MAAMLMGIPAGSMGISDSYVEQDKYLALYLADDWKITKKLTVNLGVRYEYESPLTERFNRAAVHFAGTAINPLNDAARAAYAKSPMLPELPVDKFQVLGGLTFANVPPNGRTYWKGEKLNFQPRIGFAYQFRPKTIIRGGYGIFKASIGVNYSNTDQTGFSQATPIVVTRDNGLSYVATNANPLPDGLTKPLGASGGLRTNIGQSVNFFREERKQPYAQRWSFGIQQELPLKAMIEASYVGNRSTRLNINRQLSSTPAQYLSTSPVRDQATIDYLGKTFPNPYYGLDPIYGSTMTRGNLLRPHNQFSGVQMVGDPAGYSWYHSLQTRIERRFASGWTVQSSYTWSKNMEAIEFLNNSDPMPSEQLGSLDRTHRLTGSGIWEIPVGRKRKFGAAMHPALNFIVGGWQLSGLYQHQSGNPLGFGNRIFNGDLHKIVLPKDQRSVDHWFTPAAQAGFETNSSRQLASNIITFPLRFNATRGPNQDKWDFAFLKAFRATERLECQFRAETFNALNHPTCTIRTRTRPARRGASSAARIRRVPGSFRSSWYSKLGREGGRRNRLPHPPLHCFSYSPRRLRLRAGKSLSRSRRKRGRRKRRRDSPSQAASAAGVFRSGRGARAAAAGSSTPALSAPSAENCAAGTGPSICCHGRRPSRCCLTAGASGYRRGRFRSPIPPRGPLSKCRFFARPRAPIRCASAWAWRRRPKDACSSPASL